MTAPSRLARHRRGLLRALIIIWLAAFIITHIPAERIPTLYASDKTLHLIGYAALAALLWLTLVSRGIHPSRRAVIVIAAMIAYATLDESTQPLMNRSASVADWHADCLGAIIATLLCELVAHLRPPFTS